MDKRTRKMRSKEKNRCQMTGKVIGNRPAVLVEHVVDYCRKLGYLVSNFKLVILFLLIIIMLPNVMAQTVFEFDWGTRANLVIVFFFVVFAILLMLFRYFIYGAMIIMILGFLMLYNGINPVLSTIVIASGVVMAFNE